MTISSDAPRKAGPYTGNGATTSFAFTYKVFAKTDIQVLVYDTDNNESLLVLDSDYSVRLNANQNTSPGGSALLNSALTSAYRLIIVSDLDYLQSLDMTNAGGYYLTALTNELDKLTIQIQQVRDITDRAILGSKLTGNALSLPAPQAGSALVWDSLGESLINSTATEYSALRADLINTSNVLKGAALVMYKQSGAGAVAQTVRAKLLTHPNTQEYALDPTGVANSTTAAQNLADGAAGYLEFLTGTYRMSQFPNKTNTYFKALGPVRINMFDAGDSALAKIRSGSIYEGFEWRSTETDLNSVRVAVDDVTGATVRNCVAKDFLNPTASNAWCFLVQRSVDCVFDTVDMANATQSHFALTDDNYNIALRNLTSRDDGGVNLNFEPNGDIGTRGCIVEGGRFSMIQGLENSTSSYANQNIVITGASGGFTLKYDGAGMTFRACKIGSIVPESTSFTYSGPLSIDNLSLLVNLITDPYLFDVSVSDTNTFWVASTTSGVSHQRINDASFGKVMRLNPGNVSSTALITTRNYIAVTAGESLAVFISNLANNVGAGTVADHVVAQWYTAGSALISETVVYTARCNGTSSGVCNDVAFLKPPATCTKMKLRISNKYSGASVANLDVGAIGLFRYTLHSAAAAAGNMDDVLRGLSMPIEKNTCYIDNVPSGSNGYGGFFVGEHIVKKTSTVGQPKGWYCTVVPGVVGDPGTLVSEGNL